MWRAYFNGKQYFKYIIIHSTMQIYIFSFICVTINILYIIHINCQKKKIFLRKKQLLLGLQIL